MQNDDQETWDQARARLISLASSPRPALPDSVKEQLRELAVALSGTPAATPIGESATVRREDFLLYSRLVDQLDVLVMDWAAKHQPWPAEGRRATAAVPGQPS